MTSNNLEASAGTVCRHQRTRRVAPIPDLGTLPPTAACTTDQVARLSGFAVVTLKTWRAKGKGPKVTFVSGRPRYLVRDLRAWLGVGQVA